jgi:hypothetical protein
VATKVGYEPGGASLRRFKPYPAYKESGVEWLGEIPAHWELAPVYARYEVAFGKMLDAKRVTGESSGCYLRNIDVQWDSVNAEGLPEMDFAARERERYLVRPGDLLVCEGARSAEPPSGVGRSRSVSTRRRFTESDRVPTKRRRASFTT